jgi:23S rRNA pseudouridine1911/1915/1917 synthase
VESLAWRAPGSLEGERLDKVVSLAARANEREIPRKLARSLIETGAVTLDGRPVRASSHRVRGGELVRVKLRGDLSKAAPPPVLRVLYRDEAVAAVEKPAGLPSEPTRDPRRPSALALARSALGLGETAFLGLPHRLDRDTSGLLLLALTPEALAALGRTFEERAGEKLYVAVVHGRVERDEGRLESFLAPVGKRGGKERMGSVRSGGKKAITLFRVVERGASRTLVECALETGRTHQIRVQLSEAGHPIVGDELYGAPQGSASRHLLHARLIEVPHPARPGEVLRVESPAPADFEAALRLS